MATTGKSLEREKMVYFSLWEDVGGLQGKLKNKEKANKLKKNAVTLQWFT